MTGALKEAYDDPNDDYRIFIREYPLESAGVGGRLASEDAAIVEATLGRGALR